MTLSVLSESVLNFISGKLLAYLCLLFSVQCFFQDVSAISDIFRSSWRQAEDVELSFFNQDLDPTDNTHFLLWTRRNPNGLQLIMLNDPLSLFTSNFVPANPTKIYVHGFTENGQHETVLRLRDRFLERENCNFISVDWELLAMAPNYFKAAANTEPVGILTGNLVKFLLANGSNPRNLHLIGFSLGAHVVGRAGNSNKGLIPRITGLDPAFPLFENVIDEARLDISDAQFVDVIHTNAGFLKRGQVGFPFSIGHVDFWPNGGSSQPSCGLNDVIDEDIVSIFRRATCSHRRAVHYFTESVRGFPEFTATQCGSYVEFKLKLCDNNRKTAMGLLVSPIARGNYFLDTKSRSPFAQGCSLC